MTAPAVPGGADPGWGWHVVRASGVLLALMVPVHVVTTVLVGDPATVTSLDQLARWDQPGWRLFDWALVVLGLAHGTVALRPVLGRGIRSPSARAVVTSVLYATAAVLASLVTFAALTVEYR